MKKSILIADREPRCYLQLRNKLIANNYHVFHAVSLEDAFEHFDIKTANLLLVDLDVPSDRIGSDLSQVTQLNPSVRIIGVTERSEGSEIAVRERLDGVAEKPFALGNLITFVHELLRNPSPWREFRYLPPRMPGLHATASHRPHRVSKFSFGATVSRSLSEREHDDHNFFRTCDSFVERLDTNGVKRKMNRARVILALLIPALWLVASMECLSNPVSGLKGEQPESGISASRHGERGSTTSACSLEQSARRWSRRLNVQSGPDGLYGPAVLSQSQFLALDWHVVPSVCPYHPPGLANCWQFHWRTALEPRAPSSVS